MNPERAATVVIKNHWENAPWDCYDNLPKFKLQSIYRKLSQDLVRGYADLDDIKCMNYLAIIWGERNRSEQDIITLIMRRKQSQIESLEKRILQPYLLQNEVY